MKESEKYITVNGLKVKTVDYNDDVELLISCSGCMDELDEAF